MLLPELERTASEKRRARIAGRLAARLQRCKESPGADRAANFESKQREAAPAPTL
jgi:hypothetical protein